MKKCSKCKEKKPISEFNRDKYNEDNLTIFCKKCRAIGYKKYWIKKKKKFNGLYTVWKDMKSRCYNLNNAKYKCYGGRGIAICKEWRNSFQTFYNWAKDEHRRWLTIDRRNNNGNYTPENCRFVTKAENTRNSRQTKLNVEKVKQIRQLLEEGKLVQYEIGKLFGVHQMTISMIKRRRTWN